MLRGSCCCRRASRMLMAFHLLISSAGTEDAPAVRMISGHPLHCQSVFCSIAREECMVYTQLFRDGRARGGQSA